MTAKVLLRSGKSLTVVSAVETPQGTFVVDTLGNRHRIEDVLTYRPEEGN